MLSKKSVALLIILFSICAAEATSVDINWIYPAGNINVSQNNFFNVSVNVTCRGGDCGTINATLDPEIGTKYNFTTCGKTGHVGPSQANCTTNYTGTSLAGLVGVTNGIQNWTVPATGRYIIEARGAQGGGSRAGRGAYVKGTFDLTAGETIYFIVGQQGTVSSQGDYGSGGGGASYVYRNVSADYPLLVAAGGGGQTENYGGVNQGYGGNGSATSVTTAGTGTGSGTGGVNGGGGGGGTDIGDLSTAGGGAGWLTNGSNGLTIRNPMGIGGLAPRFGATGGNTTHPSYTMGVGGFGGGGSMSDNSGAGGGGGGYNGGGGGNNYLSGVWGAGGGGGSYNSGTNQTNTTGINTGSGSIAITFLSLAGKNGVISVNPSATPFYTNVTNPFTTLSLNEGQSEVITWWVNATGTLNLPYAFFVYANQTSNLSVGNTTSIWNVTIKDTTAPNVAIVYPTETTYATMITRLNYSYSDFNAGSCWYSTNGGATNSSANSAGINFTGLTSSGGSNTWTVYCNDSSGNLASDSVTFISDIPVVGLTLISPTGNINVTQNQLFEVRARVSCSNNDCGEINVTLTESSTSTNPLLGDGSDGALNVNSANTIVNNYTYLGGNESSGDNVILVNDSSAFSAGDEILIMQMQNYSNGVAGSYEFLKITSKDGNALTLNSVLANSYYSGVFNQTNATVTQVVKVPQYTSVTVNSSSSVTASAWNGFSGGIVVLRATGNVNVTGSINSSAKGYRGGTKSAAIYANGQQGESHTGLGIGPETSSTQDNTFIWSANRGGGGGGGSTDNSGDNVGGGGGGGGYGANGTKCTYTSYSSRCGDTGGTYGDANLTRIYLGSGGGAGGTDEGTGVDIGAGSGGAGGGIIMLFANNVTITGAILSNGQDGLSYSAGSYDDGSGGGGSGGSIYLYSNNFNLGTNLTNAAGGIGPNSGYGSPTNKGGNGGFGRIRLYYSNISGTTNPNYNGSVTSGTVASGSSGAVSMISGTTPFYTNVTNPYNVSLNEGESATVSWWVNATGDPDTNHTFFVYANMTSDLIIGAATQTWNVTITNSTNGTYSSGTDSSGPVITILYPINNLNYLSDVSHINYSASDASDVDVCWYSKNFGATNSSTVSPGTNFTSLTSSEGWNNWTVYCNDSLGNLGSSVSGFYKDTIVPAFGAISNQVIEYADDLDYDLDASDSSGIGCFTVNDTTNFRINCSGYLENKILLNVGTYNLNITVNDSVGNRNSAILSVTVANTNLLYVTLNSPPASYSNTTETSLNISFNCSAADDTGLANLSLYLTNNQSQNFIINQTKNVSGVSNSTNWTLNLGIGNYIWNCFASDIAGGTDWGSNRTITIALADADGDGVVDRIDNLEGTEPSVGGSGVSNLNITVGGNSSSGSYNGTQEIIFYDSASPVLNFTHNFSASELDLSKINIIKSSNYLIVNLSGQLQTSHNKSLYVSDNNFASLCVKDAEISSVSEISSSCTGENETDFTSCLGTGNETILNGTTCIDEGTIIRIGNLRHSGVRGTAAATQENVVSGGGGSSGGGAGKAAECVLDKDCKEGYSCFNSQCVKLFDVEILEVAPLIDTLEVKLKYFIKGMAEINGDVIIKFWIENGDEKIELGQDAIYLNSFEEKTKITTLNLPYDITKKSYDLYVQVTFENYQVESFRKINIKIPEEAALSPMPQAPSEKTGLTMKDVLILLLIVVIIVGYFHYRRRKRRKAGFEKEIMKMKRSKIPRKLAASLKEILERIYLNLKYVKNKILIYFVHQIYRKSGSRKKGRKVKKVGRYAGLTSIAGKKVYSLWGDEIGTVEEPILQESKVYGWVIRPVQKYGTKNKVLIRQENVVEIKEIMIVDAEIGECLEMKY